MYKKCAGVGDRLNPQRGAPDVNMKDAFLEFGRDKYKRSREKVFISECGYKMEKIEKLSTRYDEMVSKFSFWSTKCKKYSADTCPANRCQFSDGICKNPKL